MSKKDSGKAGDSLRSLPNVGKVLEEKLKQIGITSRKEFLKWQP